MRPRRAALLAPSRVRLAAEPGRARGPWAGVAALALVVLAAPLPALAVFTGEMSARAPSGDADYAAGVAAFDAQDWPGVVAAMTRVVERRPHHDNAWTRLGYAHRKLRDYEEALDAYGRALSINPTNRSAMEYLGEAYLELGRVWEAHRLLDRLAAECRRVALGFSDGDFTDGCDEWATLAAIEAHRDGEEIANPYAR